MQEKKKKKVCMFVYNSFTHDARVLKEAKTLVSAGYDVRVVALLSKETRHYEELGSIRVFRIARKPIQIRIKKMCRAKVDKYKRGMGHIKELCKAALDECKSGIMGISFSEREKALIPKALVPKDAKVHLKSSLLWCFEILEQLLLGIFTIIMILSYTLLIPFATVGRLLKKRLEVFNRPLDFLDYNFKAFNVIEKESADIYHAHDLNTLPVAWWASRKHGAKLVYDSHELFTEIKTWNRFEKILYTILERFLIKLPDKVITVNNSIGDELVKRYSIQHPTIIINCPPPLKSKIKNHSNDLLRKAAEIPKDKKLVLYQGGFSAHRGLEELIESFEYLSDDYCLVFMGYGKIHSDLGNLVDSKGLQNRIKFLPAVSQEVLLEHTSSADLGVIPYKPVSLNNYYTLPNKLFEYINAYIPVVGSDVPELRRVIMGGAIGQLFDPNKPQSIAAAINYVLSDNDRYVTMKANTIKSSKEFNWDNESKKLLDCYDSL